jgi:carboxypeptidase C (cathepsin A)
MSFKLLCLVLLAVVSLQQSSQDDFVQFNVPFYSHDWYSGYLNISYKDIHYVYLESQNDRDNDPLLLWVAGGPGCSGLYSMLYEVGPFRFLNPESALLNVSDYAWNKKANLLFFEAPGGVGFSRGPANATDNTTVEDLLFSLIEFYARFPTQMKNDVYLAGHGYAGILVPKLAKLIDERNRLSYLTKINLKGIMYL